MWFKIFKLLTWDSKKQTVSGRIKESAEDEKATTELSQNNADLKELEIRKLMQTNGLQTLSY